MSKQREQCYLRRRHRHNAPRLWSAVGFSMLVVLGFFLASCTSESHTSQPTITVIPTDSPTVMPTPTILATATETPPPVPTTVPMFWNRVSPGEEVRRDRVNALAVAPNNADILYAGLEHSGIYKSVDGGLSWLPASSGVSNAHIRSLLIDAQDSGIAYAGTMGGIFKTEDGGENWSRIGEGNHLLMNPQDSSHLYARDADNIYESTDQGASWKAMYSSLAGCPGKIISWAIHPTDGKTLFLGGGETCEAGIYMSTNDLRSWTVLWAIPASETAGQYDYIPYLDPFSIGLDPSGNYYLDTAWGLWRSRSYDGTLLWKYIPNVGLPAVFNITDSIYFYCDPFLCKYKLNEDQRVKLGKPDVGPVSFIVISPHDPNTIYVGGEGIAVTRDGGQTWSKANNGLGRNFMTLETGQGDPAFLYLLPFVKCDELNFPYLGSRKERRQEPGQPLFLSRDGGQAWDLVSETGCHLIKDADGITLYRIARAIHYCEGCQNPDGWIWRSQNGGQTWQKVISLHIFWRLLTLVADPTQSGTLFALNSDAEPPTQFVSYDYGREWERTNPPLEIKSCHGSTLQFIDAYRPMAIDPNDGNHVFVIENGILRESHDSCDTTSAFASAPNTSMNSIAFDPNQPTTLYAGTDSGAFVSFDSGQTWNEINDGLLGVTVVYSIVVDKESNVYAATPHGIFRLEVSE